MKLQILVPQYKETDEVIKALHAKGYKIAICSMSSPALIEDFIKYNHLDTYTSITNPP